MPVKPKTMSLRFPALGVVRRQVLERSYSAANYGTPWACNCRLEDNLTNRLRGGSFTGISAGTRPTSIIYRDRLLTFSSNAITASRSGTHSDTTLSADVSDMFRPALLQLQYQITGASEVGGTVVALIPHKDSYLVCFTATEVWVLSGDPLTGLMRRISDQVGIVGADAWCVHHDTVYFLSSNGLYSIGADGSGLKPLSEDKVPDDLTGVTDSTCTLTYNHADRGVYIHIASVVDWFYDTERDQFWPFTTDTTDSHVLIGPLRLGNVNAYGLVTKLYGVIAKGSADVDFRIVKGETAEDAAADGKTAIEAAVAGTAYGAYVASEGTWSAGRSFMFHPRVRAAWCCVWLHSEGTWAWENMVLQTLVAGRWR